MKTRSCLICILAAIIGTVVSCTDRDSRVRSALEAADSLMTVSPEAALDTLLTVNSATSASLRGRERADYTLLMTEARYKCYLPVAATSSSSACSIPESESSIKTMFSMLKRQWLGTVRPCYVSGKPGRRADDVYLPVVGIGICGNIGRFITRSRVV